MAAEFGWKGRILETTLKRSAESLASKAIKEGAKHIVVCGGDGSVMEVVAAAVNTKVSIGIVPIGTGNLCAQNLNISLDLKEALKTAIKGKKTAIDVGKANGTYFTIMTGVGLDAAMLKEADRGLKNKIGVLAYFYALIKNAFKSRGLYEIKIDKKKKIKVKAKTIMVANMGEIMGGIEVVPHAHPQNGTLKVAILKTKSPLSWLELLFSAAKSSIKDSSHYTLLEGRHIDIHFLNGKRVYECDGNLLPATDRLEIDIFPKSLNVFVPSIKI